MKRRRHLTVRYVVTTRPGAIIPQRRLAVAIEWLREKELEQERRERRMLGYAKWAWDAAFAAAVLTAIGIGVSLWLGLSN